MNARAELTVDLAAIRHNVRRLRELTGCDLGAGPPAMMTVVKADGYGHGMVQVAREARSAGADWLGVATIDEAVALRDAGDTGPLLCWLGVPGEDYAAALSREVEVSAYTLAELVEIENAAKAADVIARVQLKVDTGLSRGGCLVDEWPALTAAARAAEGRGHLLVTGIWTHPACSDEPDHPANDAQEAVFRDALQVAAEAGLRPVVRHFANSAAAVLRPSVRFDMVRCGIASYGFDPAPHTGHGVDLGLVPAMTARATLSLVKEVPAGAGVSYGHLWVAESPTRLGLVPAGYGDGVPRAATNRAETFVGGLRRPVRGRICMDQFMVEVDDQVSAGDEVILFGTGYDGGPTGQDWADACETISYEIVTRIGGRFARVHVDSGFDGGAS